MANTTTPTKSSGRNNKPARTKPAPGLLAARWAVNYFFLLSGSTATLWSVHLPQIETDLHLSHAQIGTIIVFTGLGALTAMQLLGQLIDKLGSKTATIFGGILLGIVLFVPGLAFNLVTICMAGFVLGVGLAACDIAQNAHAVEVEKAYGKHIFSTFHAFWSFGGLLGAAIGGLALAANIPMWLTLCVAGAAGLVGTFISGKYLITGKAHESASAEKLDKAAARDLKRQQNQANRKYLLPILVIGVMCAGGALIEGVGIDWSSLFEVKQLGAATSQGAIAVMVFSTGMGIFRLIADRFVARFGRLFVVRVGGFLAAIGIAGAISVNSIPISTAFWFIAGLGISSVVPQLFAYSATIGEESHSGRNLAKVFGITYAGMLGGPAIIGWLTTMFSLGQALSIGVALGIIIAVGALFMPNQRADKNW